MSLLVEMTLKDVVNLFFILLVFFPKLHIVETSGKKNILIHFGPISAILEDYLTENEIKFMKQKSCTMLIPTLSVASVFLIFSQERLKKRRKIIFLKVAEKGRKVGCTFSHAVRACVHVNTYIHY